jgi:hypothetical protein
LKRLKDEAVSSAAKYYKQRTPKKPTDLTSKVQLKKMVEELETEIGMSCVLSLSVYFVTLSFANQDYVHGSMRYVMNLEKFSCTYH